MSRGVKVGARSMADSQPPWQAPFAVGAGTLAAAVQTIRLCQAGMLACWQDDAVLSFRLRHGLVYNRSSLFHYQSDEINVVDAAPQ